MAELDPQAKEMIRKYMLTLVVLPASVLSVVGFALGWFINEGARGAAYSKAYGEAQTEIIKLASAAAASAANAEETASNIEKAKQDLDKSLETVSKITRQAEDYGKKINTVVKAEEGLANEVALALLKDPDTLSLKITQEYGDKLEEADSRVAALENIENTSVIDAARAVCYSALTGNNDHSLILVPLPNNNANLDSVCHTSINNGWRAGGVAKGRYFDQDCGSSLDNKLYGGGYTAYVTEKYFEENRGKYPSCNKENAFICCSPQFPN
ncbi:MAG: hypothetical protein JAY74_08560 [Candidatus Thiodiazotropha taylori]|nr:hypothetical protein [Candidatus Thiodiazotropha taylori]